ncbi:MAG: hypothetical protein WC666_01955 [Candidatus Paceibacterota bacterium]|jgi:hypothetical protein
MKKQQIKVGSLIQTGTEIAPFMLPLLDPQIVSDPQTLIVKVAQSIGTYFISKFTGAYSEKIKSKEIKSKDYFTEKPMLSFVELLRMINDGNIDKERFNAIKSIFFYGISINSVEKDEFWSYEFIQTIKKISSTEVLILRAAYEIAENKSNTEVLKRLENKSNPQMRSGWRNTISLQMNLGGGDSIVLKYEENLEKLGLISPRHEDDRFSTEFTPTSKCRLTDMGYMFCRFITRYE